MMFLIFHKQKYKQLERDMTIIIQHQNFVAEQTDDNPDEPGYSIVYPVFLRQEPELLDSGIDYNVMDQFLRAS